MVTVDAQLVAAEVRDRGARAILTIVATAWRSDAYKNNADSLQDQTKPAEAK